METFHILFRGKSGPFALMLLLSVLRLTTSAAQSGDYIYSVTNNTITITGYTGPGGVITIPSNINGQPVTAIGALAFHANSNLTAVTIPNGVTLIGDSAFQYCASLTNVLIGQSVTNIASYAFRYCVQLPAIVIPENVTRIGSETFYACTSLAKITLGNSITSIGNYTFVRCHSLTNVTLPNNLITLGEGAFINCPNLSSITLPNSLPTIPSQTFWSCSNLVSITIPNSVTNVMDSSFAFCVSLTRVCFWGHAPRITGYRQFAFATNAIVYYLPGTLGWGTTFAERPTALWDLPTPTILNSGPSFGVQSNRFTFRISWATNAAVAVEAATNLVAPNWTALATNALNSGWTDFTDPQWTNHPARFYRVRSL